MAHLTQEVRDMIGVSGPITTSAPLDPDRLRRFVQAVMEENPVHWDTDAAHSSRYGGLVATPLWPLHAHVRLPDEPDPLDELEKDAEWDGTPRTNPGNLPSLPIDLTRVLNGGTSAEFYQLARVGDTITSTSKYVDIYERQGRTGPMVIARIETTHRNQNDELLAVVTMSIIWR